MTNLSKHEQSAQLRDELSGVSAFVLVDYTGMTVAEASDLRNKFRDAKCRYQVYKNSVIHYAVAGTKLAVEYMGERYPVTVAVAGNTPLFDPEDARMKA